MDASASNPQEKKSTAKHMVCGLLRRFQKDESGALIVFALFLFVAMLMIGGMAVDFMRYEATRTRLQNTVDRAVLAAASMDQELQPVSVVKDYFIKAGLRDTLTEAYLSSPNGARKVRAEAQAKTQPFFLGMVGIDELIAPASATAEQSVGNVEISLVLDVSGSMGGSKIASLKTAAKDFVDKLYQNPGSTDHNSMSIITYASQVSAGKTLLSKFNLISDHDKSYCVNFSEDDYLTTEISTTDPIQQTAHFDPYTYTKSGPNSYFQCPTNSDRDILTFANDPDVLKSYIDNFIADGATGTEIGIKWGAALLDPSTRPAINGLIQDTKISAVFQDRPADYATPETLKVMVVMTDGQNNANYTLKPAYRTGNSDIWYNPDNDKYSVYDADRRQYYRVRKNAPWNYGTWANTPYGGKSSYQLPYSELWSKVSVHWNAEYHHYVKEYWDEAVFDSWIYNTMDVREADLKNQLMNNICAAAKKQGILLFTIGFQVNSTIASRLENCATKESFFYRIEDLNIADAFESIGSQITRLRLTQ